MPDIIFAGSTDFISGVSPGGAKALRSARREMNRGQTTSKGPESCRATTLSIRCRRFPRTSVCPMERSAGRIDGAIARVLFPPTRKEDLMNGSRGYSVQVEGAKYEVSFGSAVAIAISYTANHSILWAIIHGIFSWLYFALFRT